MDYAEHVSDAKNWLSKQLGNYWNEDVRQFIRPPTEAMRIERYFRIYIDDGCLVFLHRQFEHSPDFFQVFLFQFWKLYFDLQANTWVSRKPSACAVHLTRWLWWNIKHRNWNPVMAPCIFFDDPI